MIAGYVRVSKPPNHDEREVTRMGEFATYGQRQVKIGTCEDMYYLRADQTHLVPDYGWSDDVLGEVRFRFPFPDEDHLEPGEFDDHARGFKIPDYTLPETLSGDEHHSVQFTSSAGYVLSIPCPEQFGQPGLSVEMPDGLHVGRNGFDGDPQIRQQAYRGGALVTLLRCGACGGIHRLDTLADAEPVIVALRSEADREEYRRGLDGFGPAHSQAERDNLHAIADRIGAGYAVVVPT